MRLRQLYTLLKSNSRDIWGHILWIYLFDPIAFDQRVELEYQFRNNMDLKWSQAEHHKKS